MLDVVDYEWTEDDKERDSELDSKMKASLIMCLKTVRIVCRF